MKPEEVDVVVVGSGAGGGPVALELAEAGAKVLVLEKGPRYQTEEFLHDEITVCRRNHFVPFPDDDPHTLRRSTQEDRSSRTNSGWISSCVGGGTVHMSGFFFRLHPKDFTLQKSYGPLKDTTAIDWPITYETLAPYYEKVETKVGVSGIGGINPFEPPRSKNYPDAPVMTHPVCTWIDRVAKKMGLNPFPTPRSIITTPRDGRKECRYCALCGSYGCETGAKSSTMASVLPAAERTKRCEIRSGAQVTEVIMMKNGRARGVTYVDDKGSHRVDAKVVVIACSAVESARLLLLSCSGSHPNGLGNNGGQLGQNLCFNTLGQVLGNFSYKDFSEADVKLLKSGHPSSFVGRAFHDLYEAEKKGDVFGKGGTFHLLWEHINPIFRAEQVLSGSDGQVVFGAELMKRLKEQFLEVRTMEVECFGEWLPTKDCNVTLDPYVTDHQGLPSARITIASRHPSDLASSQLLVDKGTEVLKAIGCSDINVKAVGGETFILQNGTCRMGTDPATSVTTPEGHLHEVDNVFVTDGAALPTSGGVPITMTIMANSFRVADQIKAHLKG